MLGIKSSAFDRQRNVRVYVANGDRGEPMATSREDDLAELSSEGIG